MSIALVQQNGSSSGGSSSTSVSLTGVTAGNLLVLAVRHSSGGPATSVTGGGTWNLAPGSQINSAWAVEIYWAYATGGSTTVTINATGSGFIDADLAEFSGMVTSGTATDSTNGANGTNATLVGTGNVTPTTSPALVVTCGSFQGASSGTPSGFTAFTTEGTDAVLPAAWAIENPASGSYSATYAAGYNHFAITIASFMSGTSGTSVTVTGLAATAAVGSITVTSVPVFAITGQAATAHVGTVTEVVSSNIAVSGQHATAALGTVSETVSSSVSVTGQAATAHLGTIAIPTAYFVANAGSDSNNGLTSGTPWQTVAKVNGHTFNPGDTISFNRGDTWSSSTFTVPTQGAPGQNITLGAYGTGAKPIIQGAVNNPAITVNAANRGYWTVDGLDLRGTGTVSGMGQSLALFHGYWSGTDLGATPGWIIQNCHATAPILVSGPSTQILNNVVDGTGNTTAVLGGIIVRYGNATGTLVDGNTVHDVVDRGIWIYGTVDAAPDHSIVRNNTCYNITAGASDTGMGINFDGYSYPVTGCSCYGNTLYDCADTGISHENCFSASTSANIIHDCLDGVHYSSYGTHRSVAVSNTFDRNILYNLNHGIALYDVNTVAMRHNVIYGATGSNASGVKVMTSTTYTANLTFVNNIIAGAFDYPLNVPDAGAIWTTLDYNCIVPTGTLMMLMIVGGNKTLSQLQALGYMAHGITANPLFTNTVTSDFTLQFGSPCIDTGVVISGINDGTGGSVHYLGSAPDIGAFESVPNLAVTGVAATAGLGSVVVSIVPVFTITGQHATAALGVPTIQNPNNITVTGQQAIAALGSVSETASASLSATGLQSVAGLGTVTVLTGTPVSVTGQSSTAHLGTITETASATMAVSGQASLAALGTVSVLTGTIVAVSGQVATTALGTVSEVVFSSTGVAGQASIAILGSIAVTSVPVFTISGLAALAALGSVTVNAAAVIPVTGLQAVAAVGSVTVNAGGNTSISVAGQVSTAALGLLAVQSGTNVSILGLAVTAGLGIPVVTLGVAYAVNGVAATARLGTVRITGADPALPYRLRVVTAGSRYRLTVES